MGAKGEGVSAAESLLTDRRVMRNAPYGAIYADPPWPVATRVRTGVAPQTASGKASWLANVSDPYQTMTEQEILDLPVEALVSGERGAVLVLWCPWAHLDLGMRTIRAWGFKYGSGCPWLKVDSKGNPCQGLGMWFRGCTEPLLVARYKEGVIQWPGNEGKSHPSPARLGLFQSRRGVHSEKPEEVAQWIEEKMPGPYLELFARRRRPGWTCWGDQVPDK